MPFSANGILRPKLIKSYVFGGSIDMKTAACVSETVFKGLKAYKMEADRYSCVVVPELGGDVMRMRDEDNKMEIFRYKDEVTLEKINEARVLWGLPTLYLPNRFDAGVLKTSDAKYVFPINEEDLNNFIHGWVHNRAHKLVKAAAEGGVAEVVTRYDFDESDEMFEYMPVKFSLVYTYTLSADGLKQEIELKNLGDKMLPVSVCTHTCISAPIVDGGRQDTMRLSVPVLKRCELNERSLPTENLPELTDYDLQYKNGEMHPVLQNIDNDMYTAGDNILDGKPMHGIIVSDLDSGRRIINEVSDEYKFWNMWNCKGSEGFFCPEPMTAMINSANLSLPREISGYGEIAPNETYTCWQRFYTM